MINKSYKIIALIILIVLLVFSGCSNAIRPDDPPVLPTDEYPAWSPDGKWVAYTHFNPDADDTTYPSGLYMMELETRQRQLLVSGFANTPDWSPDGERIAVSRGDIFSISLDNKEITRLTNFGSSFFPRWSPDSQKISFGRSGSQDIVGIWVLEITSDESNKFGFGAPPADWSKDGQQIVYSGSPSSNNQESQIWTANIDSSEITQLTFNDFSANRYASWSPDGFMITWTALKAKIYEIWIMNADGSNQRKLTSGYYSAWSPDSKSLVFSRQTNADDKIVLWTININGTELKQITF